MGNMLQEKNTDDEGISERSVRRFVIVIISEGFGNDHPSYSAFWITFLSL